MAIDYNNLTTEEVKSILKKFQKGTKFTITSRPLQWSSSLNTICPFNGFVIYPYYGEIVNILYDNDPVHISIDDGHYGWSLSSLLKDDKIITDLKSQRKNKLKKLNKLNKQGMKLFEVSIDNNYGEWKSGRDPHVLVPANTKEEAIQKVKDGWDAKYEFPKDGTVITYMKMEKEFPIRDDCRLSASEIKFDGLDIHIKSVRHAKLDRIEKNSKKSEI